MTEAEKWILACTIIMAAGTIAAVAISIIALNKKQEVKVDQPLSIEIVEELHERFAAKRAFDELVKHNTERHGQLFNRIEAVENEYRRELGRQIEKVNEHFTFIREHIAAINRELKIRHEQ